MACSFKQRQKDRADHQPAPVSRFFAKPVPIPWPGARKKGRGSAGARPLQSSNGRIVSVIGFALLAGCHEPAGPKVVSNPDSTVKIQAIKQAVAAQDRRQAADMVNALESDDPAVRMYAIEGLQRMCGQDFGYRYYAEPDQRRPAVEKWKQWLDGESDD
jgi:hypothetical protein